MTFWTCSSLALCSITMTICVVSSLLRFRLALLFGLASQAFQPSALVDHALEDAPERVAVERARVVLLDAVEDPLLAVGLVDGHPDRALDAADLDRARRAAVQQLHQLVVDLVDAPPQIGDLGLPPAYVVLVSHFTRAPRSPCGCSSRKRTRALPTTTASAAAAASFTCSGVEIPKPRATGTAVSARSRATSGRASSESAWRSPVTPMRLMAYTKPRLASATFRSRSSGLVGDARKIVSSSAARAAAIQASPSSGGRSVTSAPSTPACAASLATRSSPRCSRGFR